jgi:hypothetical protein
VPSPVRGSLRASPTTLGRGGQRRIERHGHHGLRALPGLSPQLYDEVVATLDLDANPPIGAILHLVGEGRTGSRSTGDLEDRAGLPGVPTTGSSRPLQFGAISQLPAVDVPHNHSTTSLPSEMETDRADRAVSLPAHVRRCGRSSERRTAFISPGSASAHETRPFAFVPFVSNDATHCVERGAKMALVMGSCLDGDEPGS